MKFFIPSLLLSVLVVTTHAQDSCKGKTSRTIKTYDIRKKLTEQGTFFYSHKLFWISLCEGFNDSIQIFVNNKLLIEGRAITNESIGIAKEVIVNFDHLSDKKIMQLILVNRNVCLTETLELNYPFLEINYNNNWQLKYINHIIKRE